MSQDSVVCSLDEIVVSLFLTIRGRSPQDRRRSCVISSQASLASPNLLSDSVVVLFVLRFKFRTDSLHRHDKGTSSNKQHILNVDEA